MARYYFHLWNGARHEIDDVGLEMSGAEDAYLECFKAAQEIWSEMIRMRQDPSSYQFDVHDEHGRSVLEVPFSEILSRPATRRPSKSADELRQRRRVLTAALAREIEEAKKNKAMSKQILARSRKERTSV